jgi:hypothetical protein
MAWFSGSRKGRGDSFVFFLNESSELPGVVRPLQRQAASSSMTETDSFPSEPMVCAEATRGVNMERRRVFGGS